MADPAGRVRRHAPLALGLLALAVFVRLPGYVLQLFDPDEATIADQAITLQHGGTLYVDAIDRKPPVPTYLYEATFSLLHTVDLRPVHLLAAFALAIAAWAVASDAGLRQPAERVWAGVLLVTGTIAFLPDAGQAANYAHFAIAPGAVAMVAARRRSTRCAVLAGLALAAAVLCRQTWLIGLVPAGFAIARDRRWAHLVWFTAAFAAGMGAMALVVSPGRFWHWTFASNQGFLLTAPDWSMVAVSFFGGLALLIGLHLAMALLLVRRVRTPAQAGTNSTWSCRHALLGPDADLWLWWATATVAWISGFRFFAHYWLQSLPPLALLAAPVAAACVGRFRRVVVGLLVLTTTAAMVGGFMPHTFRQLADPDPLAAYVAAHTAPGERVLVWGNFPEVQWRADRPLGGALVHSDFVTGVSGNRSLGPLTLAAGTPGATRAMLDAVHAHPPRLVLDTSTAYIRFYERYPLTVFPQLAQFVRQRYDVVATVDGVRIYRLRG